MQISICGAGWLGEPLAAHLASQGHSLIASSTQTNKLTRFTQQGWQGLHLDIYAPAANTLQAVKQSDVLVLNIPAGRKKNTLPDYQDAMLALVNLLAEAPQLKVLFVSTTSVYGNAVGEINEQQTAAPVTASGQANWAIEQQVRQLFGKNASVVRLAGLVGGMRHPARNLSGRMLTNGNQPVNLLHRDDAIAAISAIIHQGHWGHTLHLCCNQHPSRADYYTWACQQLALPPPTFDDQQQPAKCINAQASWTALNLTPHYASPYHMLE